MLWTACVTSIFMAINPQPETTRTISLRFQPPFKMGEIKTTSKEIPWRLNFSYQP